MTDILKVLQTYQHMDETYHQLTVQRDTAHLARVVARQALSDAIGNGKHATVGETLITVSKHGGITIEPLVRFPTDDTPATSQSPSD